MLDTVVFRRLRAAARRFAGANDGNIAILFGIAVIPIISFVGAAVDYTRAVSARSSMQAALDSTALMLAKDLTEGTITTSQISAKADAYFRALFTNTETKSIAITATYTQNSGNGSTILVNGSGNIETGFMRVVGFPTMDFNTSSTSAWGNVRMRVAMVLDVTGSMSSSGKMGAMQTAAKSLVDQLGALAKNPGDIYISMVPFAKDVNLGSSYYNSTWIDWSRWDSQSYTNTWGTCSKSSYTDRDTCKYYGKTWTPDRTKWTGCVTDRTQDYDTKNTTPTSANAPTMVVAEEYVSGSTYYCKTGSSTRVGQIVPLSYDWSSIKTAIDALQPTGNTNQGIGLAWGWLTLGMSDPFNAPAKDTANYTYKEAIVLLSDGLNTQNRWYSNASQIDARQKILCDNAKAANIVIYTVQVNTGGDPTSAVLQYCASGTDKFFLVTDPNQTLSVFNSIGQSLAKLRVYK
ncbi:pilus assembly protein [Bradyrhizobium sp. AUGA SZCCT0283]|uniref:vWA domain-containing protein n=1 Tax=Bradyrhizobium sp. AUGA SZCCT0283 TaxID=2807671 RepID=UPI001BABB3DC|nr:pilus assembly protein [Bradyrhizobium sp. AUGA SZCCT0283]MBR1278152.1 TadE/TadG family protein [Bradyrhizobium sp. AUGA SZCCT0283]